MNVGQVRPITKARYIFAPFELAQSDMHILSLKHRDRMVDVVQMLTNTNAESKSERDDLR